MTKCEVNGFLFLFFFTTASATTAATTTVVAFTATAVGTADTLFTAALSFNNIA